MSNINVTIWRNLLQQGVNPAHVLKQACDHEGNLDALPFSDERDQAIKEVVAFIKEVSELVEHKD